MRKSWEDLGVTLHEEIKEGIKSFNFATMTPIQAATIPQLINKKDVVAEAVTGSGKTLAFLIPLLEILKRRQKEAKWKKHEIGAVIISPTRELALQTKEVLEQLLKFVKGLSHLLLVGGTSIDEDLAVFARSGANIVTCTPGRFEDLLTRKPSTPLPSSLKSLEILVLDEADRLLDCGFRKCLDVILAHLPRQRRTGLFSATQTKQVQDLIRAGLRNPVVVSVRAKNAHSTPDKLDNYYVVANDDNKLAALLAFVEGGPPREGVAAVEKGLVFLPTCACVDYWGAVLPLVLKGIPVMALHGKMKEKRRKALERFKEAERGLLLCTDVLARGIDIPEVDWVLQWEPPTVASAFVHRVGRTARRGLGGSSVTFLLSTEEPYVHFIEKNQRVHLEPLEDASTPDRASAALATLRQLQRSDRDLVDKATRAFVSHVRAYSKHECSLLLKVKEFPFGRVATTYGLLQLPKMPELRNFDGSGFVPEDVDLNEIGYRDGAREAARKRKLEVYERTGAWPGKKGRARKATEAWSESKRKKGERKERRLKRKKAKEGGGARKRRREGVSEEEMRELEADIRLMKRLKKGKISEGEFEREFGVA